MRSLNKSFLVAATVLMSLTAQAKDSQLLSCSGIVSAVDDPSLQFGLSLTFFEGRASDGESRNEVLSVVYQNKLFQGRHLNQSASFSKNAPLVLEDTLDPSSILFQGTYTLIQKQSRGAPSYSLLLKGRLTDNPSAQTSSEEFFKIETVIPCRDLST